jgi:ferric-dicitrate binding protein FerR (iron transport regulator)
MNKKGLAFSMALLVGAFFLSAAKSKRTKIGAITFVSGSAYVVKNKGPKKVKISMPVRIGQKLKTAQQSLLEITLNNGTIIRLNENTEIKLLGDLENFSPLLIKGQIWNKVKKLSNSDYSYSVKTTVATAAVRGTAFNVSAQDSSTSVALYSGQLDVTKNQEPSGLDNSPHEISGPREVSLTNWIKIDPGQMIQINWDGTYLKSSTPNNPWVDFNQKRDSLMVNPK